MAQEVPPPPGLDGLSCKQQEDSKEVAQESSRRAFARAVHEKVQHELDERVAGRLDELWTKGQQVLLQSHQRHGDATRRLQKELGECRTKQQSLEAQNEQLEQMLQTLTFRLSFLGQVLGSKDGCSEVVDESTIARETSAGSAGSCAPESRSASELSAVAGSVSPSPAPAPPPVLPSHILGTPAEAPPPALPSHILGTPTEASWLPGAAQISLAEALSGPTLELAGQLPPILPLPATAVSVPPVSPLPLAFGTPVGAAEKGSGTFTFTLRKADGADLGINVSHRELDSALHVIEVRPGGAVDAWNRQCAGTACSEKAVKAGDNIISANMITGDPARMLEECREKQLLKLVLVRGDGVLPPASTAATLAATAATTPTISVAEASPRHSGNLCADACVFVPSNCMAASAMSPLAINSYAEPLEA